MKIRSLVAGAKIAFVILLVHAATAVASEIKLATTPGMRPAMTEIVPQFERATGHKVTAQYGLSVVLVRQLEAGETFDLAILSPAVIDDLTKQGKIAGGTRTMIARAGIGVAVRAGAPRPDISSVDAFKRALLNAKSIAYAPVGTTGAHLAKVFERLGIAEEMKAKTKPQPAGERIAQAVAAGDAELGFAVVSVILPVRGAEVLGLFPAELQDWAVYEAGVGAAAKEAEAAKALINFLRTEGAVSVLKAKGLEALPPGR